MGEKEDFSELINSSAADGWVSANGLRFTLATVDEVKAELEIRAEHRQAYGIVHGGVHSAVIETLASVGAALTAFPQGRSVVGLENHTSFIRAVREGVLYASARPLTRGRRSQLWEAWIHDAGGKLLATGRVRLLVLEQGAQLAGEAAGLRDGV